MSAHADSIRIQLSRGPQKIRQLVDSLGLSQPTISRAINTLGDEIVRIGNGRSIQYALPDTRYQIPDTRRGIGEIQVFRVSAEGTTYVQTADGPREVIVKFTLAEDNPVTERRRYPLRPARSGDSCRHFAASVDTCRPDRTTLCGQAAQRAGIFPGIHGMHRSTDPPYRFGKRQNSAPGIEDGPIYRQREPRPGRIRREAGPERESVV